LIQQSNNSRSKLLVTPKETVIKYSGYPRKSKGAFFGGESEKGFVIPDHMDSSTPKKTQNPKNDYFVMTRQAEGHATFVSK